MAKQRLKLAMTTLHNVSPLSTLDRGYTITTKKAQVVSSSEDINPGDELTIRFHDGEKGVVAK